jgi:hypothetical protein
MSPLQAHLSFLSSQVVLRLESYPYKFTNNHTHEEVYNLYEYRLFAVRS